MIGIIADNAYELTMITEGEEEGLYCSDFSGYLEEIAGLVGEDRRGNFSVLTEIGVDNQGNSIEDWYKTNYDFDIEFLNTKALYTTIAIDGDKRLRGSASGNIKKSDILSFIDEKKVDTLIVSAPLLSFTPSSDEITSAIKERKGTLSRIIVDTSISWDILRLETMKESMEDLLHSGFVLYTVGDALSIEGVKRMSLDHRNRILLEEKSEK